MKELFLAVFLFFLSLSISGQNAELIGYFPFDNDLEDYSGNNNNGTELGTLFYSEETGCVSLNIANNAMNGVQLNPNLINGLSDFSISFYGRISEFNNSNNFLSGASSTSANDLLISYNSVGTYPVDGWIFRIGNEPYFFAENELMNDFDWHHIVINRSGNTASLYIDNVKIGDDVPVSARVFDIPEMGLVLGQDQDCIGGCFQVDQNWSGGVDELRFYDGALSITEIDSLYKLTFCNPTNTVLFEEENEFNVFPNPASNNITIEALNSENKYQVALFAMDGKLVLEEKLNNERVVLELNQIQKSSMYILVFYDESGVVVKVEKVVVR